MAKPIGGKIRIVCETAQGNGGWTDSPMMRKVFDCPAAEAHVYLGRAVGLGLMEVDRSTYPQRYYLKDGWQAIIGPIEKKAIPESNKRVRSVLPKPHSLASVWM